MAAYGLFAAHPEASVADVEEHFDGNLCRCTGYRPIWDAAKAMCAEKCGAGADIEDCAGRHGKTGCGGGCGAAKTDSETKSACSHSSSSSEVCLGGAGADKACVVKSSTADKLEAETVPAVSAPLIPDELREALAAPTAQAPLCLANADGKGRWWRPTGLLQLLVVLQQQPDARVLVGNTEVGIETKFKGVPLPNAVSTAGCPELYTLSIDSTELRVGAALSLSALQAACGPSCQPRSRVCAAIHNMLRWFASTQIRNVACLGGNLATASPISDMNPVLSASGASLRLVKAGPDKDGNVGVRAMERRVRVSDFFLSYRRVDLQPGEIIAEVLIPQVRPFEYILPFKQARRREDDISIVTSCMRVLLQPKGGCWRVAEVELSFGGMAPTTVTAVQTASAMTGQTWGEAALQGASAALLAEMDLPDDVPGGQAQFRRTLACSFLYKFYVAVNQQLTADIAIASTPLPAAPSVDARDASAAQSFVTSPKPRISGTQTYTARAQPEVGQETLLTHGPPPRSEPSKEAGPVSAAGNRSIFLIFLCRPFSLCLFPSTSHLFFSTCTHLHSLVLNHYCRHRRILQCIVVRMPPGRCTPLARPSIQTTSQTCPARCTEYWWVPHAPGEESF
jgi:xanthine dehydrogenase/oxidase